MMFMRKLGLLLVALTAAFVCGRTAVAIAPFQKVFMEEYIDKHEDKEFAKYVKTKAKCHICHQGKKRTNHNAYGVHLVDLLDKKKDIRDVEKIKAALEKVAKMHSDPKDDKSPTYGDLIKESKLPGGDLEELLKEPRDEESK
jgi:hypothetical protein